MSCKCGNNGARIKWVEGNTRRIAITLEELADVKTGETVAFVIEEGDLVSVSLKGMLSSHVYDVEAEGNVLRFDVGAELTVGDYVVEVTVKRGERVFVSRKRWELSVVRYDDEAGLPDDAEFSEDELALLANMYIKGDAMTWGDMSEDDKDDLAERSAERMKGGLWIDDEGWLCYGLSVES